MARKRKPAETDVVEEVVDGGTTDEPDDDDGEGFTTAQFLDPAWKPPPPKSPSERKVTNKYIPLFPDATKDPKRHATTIKVYKTSPPDDGYKGETGSPETVDEAFIASLWGDGIFRLELLDQAKNVLRTRDNVKVSTGGGASKSNGHSNGHGGEDLKSILTTLTDKFTDTIKTITASNDARLEREEARLAALRTDELARSTQHTTLLGGLVKGEAEQLRAHYAAQQAASEAGSRMLLAMMTQAHTQSMQMMLGMQQQQQSRSDPLLFLRVYQEGQNASPEDGAAKVVDNITKGLDSLRGLANAGGGNGGGNAGADATTKLPASTTPNGNGKPAVNGVKAAAGAKALSKEELREIVTLKRVLKAKGMSDADFLDLVKQAREQYAGGAPLEEIDDDEEDDETDEERAERLAKRKKGKDGDTSQQPADDVDRAGPPDA